MREALQRAWLHRGGLALLLWPLSLLYRALAGAHRLIYQCGLRPVAKAGVPLIVVGNVVAGGAGKTPVVIALVQRLQQRGCKVGVVSRGHGRRGSEPLAVSPASDPALAGDEPLLVARRCSVPVVVARRRADAVRLLRTRNPDVQVVVSDDGLQHHALARDIEICVFDQRGVGNGWLLPAGPLREAWPRPVDFVLRAPDTPGIDGFVLHRRLARDAVRADGVRKPLGGFAGQPCDALAGIAQPGMFFSMLREAGIVLRHEIGLPDHHDFADGRVRSTPGVPLLCTEKDAVKLWGAEPGAWAVPLELEIDPAFWTALEERLDRSLSSAHGPQAA